LRKNSQFPQAIKFDPSRQNASCTGGAIGRKYGQALGRFKMPYLDGYVLRVLPGKTEEYRAMAAKSAATWMKHGALAYSEALADDVPYGKVTSFPRAVGASEGELVAVGFILYRDRAHRDEVNAKVMADPFMQQNMSEAPIDMRGMIYGGFQSVVAEGLDKL
jgi:uncharacterized protein YbaA (DUF1428 family)